MTCFDDKRRVFLLGASATVATACFSASDDSSTGDDAAVDEVGDEPEDDPCASTPGTYVGDETTFAQGTWTLVGQLIVAQDANGFFAYTAICTHQGCIIGKPASNGHSTCPCHFSQFDGNGKVLVGPASTPLRHFALAVCNGGVYVDTSTVVSASTRTPPA
jgi:Rieske Fe-S protein